MQPFFIIFLFLNFYSFSNSFNKFFEYHHWYICLVTNSSSWAKNAHGKTQNYLITLLTHLRHFFWLRSPIHSFSHHVAPLYSITCRGIEIKFSFNSHTTSEARSSPVQQQRTLLFRLGPGYRFFVEDLPRFILRAWNRFGDTMSSHCQMSETCFHP